MKFVSALSCGEKTLENYFGRRNLEAVTLTDHKKYGLIIFRRMKVHLTILALVIAAGVALAADKPVDLTGADASKFRLELGHLVSLRGRLEQGMQGPCLFGAMPTNVVFYVIPEMSASESYFYPEIWTRLTHQQVRLTGELRFRTFDRSKAGPLDQTPSDYYYMVVQRTRIERIESK